MANYIVTNHTVLISHMMVLLIVFTLNVFINPMISSIIRESQNEINHNSKDHWALIIGTDNQSSYSFGDAIEISKRFISLWGEERVSLALTSNKTTIENLFFEWLAKNEDTDDTVLIYFSGHGNCENISIENNSNNNESNISACELNNWLSYLESLNIILLLDCCESGCFAQNISTNEPVIITGCTDREICWQVDLYKHGIFTYYLLDAFENQSEVNTNNDCIVTVEELYQYIVKMMQIEFRQYPVASPQNPFIIDHSKRNLPLFHVIN